MTLHPAGRATNLKWTIERDGSVTTLALSGELDVAISEEASVRLRQMLSHVDGSVMIDVGSISFMDSSGLRLLVDLRHAANEEGLKLFLARLSLPVRRVLDVAGLSHWFDYVEGEPPKLAYCPICEGELHIDVTRCPYCGSVL